MQPRAGAAVEAAAAAEGAEEEKAGFQYGFSMRPVTAAVAAGGASASTYSTNASCLPAARAEWESQ